MSAATLSAWTAVGWTMLHTIWVGAILGAAAAVSRHASRKARPEVRYALALAWFAALVAMPAIVYRVVNEDPRSREPQQIAARLDSASRANDSADTEAKAAAQLNLKPIALAPQAEPTTPTPWLARFVSHLPWLWLSGTAASLAWVAGGFIGIERLRRASRCLSSQHDLSRRCHTLAETLRCTRRISMAISDRVITPALVGVFRPLIVLPAAALTHWNADDVELALLHELAHLKRLDNFVNVLQRLGESFLFYHPAAWWISAWIRFERELCCDAAVIAHTGRRHAYAEMLVALASGKTQHKLALLGMANQQIVARVRRLFGREETLTMGTPEGFGIAAVLMVAATLTFGARGAQDEPRIDPARTTLSRLAVAAEELGGDADRESQEYALTGIVRAQIKLGDKAGALKTLDRIASKRLGAEVTNPDMNRISTSIEAARLRREAGDLDGAKAALDRLSTLVEQMPEEGGAVEVAPAGADRMRIETLTPAMEKDELLAFLVEERLALDDRAEAARLSRLGAALAEKDATIGPLMGAGFALLLHRAGDTEGAREIAAKSRDAATQIGDPRLREHLLSYAGWALLRCGDATAAIDVFRSLPESERSNVLQRTAASLAVDDPDEQLESFEVNGFKLLVGAPGLKVVDPNAARPALAVLAKMGAEFTDPVKRARALSLIADMQAKAGDVTAARATAAAIPENLGAPKDSFGDALRPATHALIARRMHEAGDHAPAAELFADAETRSKAIAQPRERLLAQLVIARERAACGQHREAIALLDDTLALALKQPEPRRSRALTMVTEGYLSSDDLDRAQRAADATREAAGLEQMRALMQIAQRLEREQGAAAARPLYQRLYESLSNPMAPMPAAQQRSTSLPAELVIDNETFADPDFEPPPGVVEDMRRMAALGLRVRLGDFDGAMRELEATPFRALPAGAIGGRRSARSAIISQLVRQGDIANALRVAEQAETPADRLSAIQFAAAALEWNRSRK